MNDLSFIILRHISSPEDNKYWNICYDHIRVIYPVTHIYIIDDYSKHVPTRIGDAMINTVIINSQFKGRGELLPYYYYYINKFSKNAVILHDTVFIKKPINSELLYTKTFHPLWTASHHSDPRHRIRYILNKINNTKFLQIFDNKKSWDTVFGAMGIINIDYLKSVFDNTNYFTTLLNYTNTRARRMVIERIVGILFNKNRISVNGNIHNNLPWGTTYKEYIKPRYILKHPNKNMYKIWVGRKNDQDLVKKIDDYNLFI